MSTYLAPTSDYLFLLEHVLNYQGKVATLPPYRDMPLDLVRAVLEEGAKVTHDVLAPINRIGDEEGCQWDHGTVTTPTGFREAYAVYREGGWPGLVAAPEFCGQGLPRVIGLIQREMISGSNTAFGTYLGLSQSAYSAISAHGSEDLQQMILPALAEGRWMGTMCLTEPHCGSDLGLIRTRAERAGDGSYRIVGTKIFVTGGEHDMVDNIVHLVLARLADGPSGTKGLSLFAVPKYLPSGSGEWDIPNALECTGIEQKMGIKGSSTATLAFDGATGWLVGTEHQGLRAMFTMMNSSRLGVAVQSVGLAEAALQMATVYAKNRCQGRSADKTKAPVPIIEHADVRRNLLSVRAFVEGARALWLWAGIQLDEHYAHPDVQRREECEGYLALLTPVLKSFFSDQSFQATNAAMQVFGGHGYIRETGIEQYVRDGRIIPLYEGTNGIQALDLVNRKITKDEGRMVDAFFGLVRQEAEEMRASRPYFSDRLDEALNLLRRATAHIVENSESDPHDRSAIAHDYLQLFGLVALGFAWSKIVRGALGVADDTANEIALRKLEVAEYFFTRVLLEADYRYQLVIAGSAPIMNLQEF